LWVATLGGFQVPSFAGFKIPDSRFQIQNRLFFIVFSLWFIVFFVWRQEHGEKIKKWIPAFTRMTRLRKNVQASARQADWLCLDYCFLSFPNIVFRLIQPGIWNLKPEIQKKLTFLMSSPKIVDTFILYTSVPGRRPPTLKLRRARQGPIHTPLP
jgi:hypothetical protein